MQAIGDKFISFFAQLYTLSMRDMREGGNHPLVRRLFLKRAFRYRTLRFLRLRRTLRLFSRRSFINSPLCVRFAAQIKVSPLLNRATSAIPVTLLPGSNLSEMGCISHVS